MTNTTIRNVIENCRR